MRLNCLDGANRPASCTSACALALTCVRPDRRSEGYKRIGESDLVNARILSRALENSTEFKVLSEIHEPASPNDPDYTDDETKAGHCASIWQPSGR